MVEKQTAKSRKSAAKRSATSRPHKGRKARIPIEFFPSAKGPGLLKPQYKNAGKSKGVGSDQEAAIDLRIPSGPQDELRDIGELTFGKRDTPSPSRQLEASMLEAASQSERIPVGAARVRMTPWRKICDLLITTIDGTRHTGTAWFISPRTLVTAGHCISVFRPGTPMHGKARSILVMPARNGETSAGQSLFGWAEVPRENLRVHPRWENNGDINFDYGVIILPATARAIGGDVGHFGYGHYRDQDLDESEPTLSGYPDDVVDGTQWFEINPIKELTATRVFYDIFTFSGQSGSPVFFRSNNRDIACAIHTFGDFPLNSGVRINPQVIAQLNAWKV